MTSRRITRIFTCALLCLSAASSADADVWASLDGSTLEIGMDEQALNAVLIEYHGGTKLKVVTMGLEAQPYGGINVVFEKNFYFATSSVKVISVLGSNGPDMVVNETSIPSRMLGGDGDDILVGGSSRDQLAGEAGDDELYGREGNDQLFGGTGEDGNHGGAGNDLLDLGGDTHERFQIGDTGKDEFVRYGIYWGPSFKVKKIFYSMDQSNIDILPEVTVKEDYNPEEGDYSTEEEL